MALSDAEITAELGANFLRIDPPPTLDRIGGSSVDLLLHDELWVLPAPHEPNVQGITIDPGDIQVMAFLERHVDKRDLRTHPYEMALGQFVLGKTVEEFSLPRHLAGRVEGRSSLGRLGLGVHVTAPTIHTGFQGQLYLEMYNTGPFTLKLRPGIKICQLILERLSIPSRVQYQGRFQGQG